MYTTRHSTPIGAAKQPPYVVAQPPLNSLGLSWSKIIRLCSAYQVCGANAMETSYRRPSNSSTLAFKPITNISVE